MLLSVKQFTLSLQVGDETSPARIHCQCNHLTSFASDFLVAPNPIDFGKVFSADLSKNPVVLIVVCLMFGLYFILVLIARRYDKKDLEKVRHFVFSLPFDFVKKEEQYRDEFSIVNWLSYILIIWEFLLSYEETQRYDSGPPTQLQFLVLEIYFQCGFCCFFADFFVCLFFL